jgi:alcohol oxidase
MADANDPCFSQTEKFHIDDPTIDRSVHGYDGDFNASRGTFTAKAIQDDFINSAASLGIREAADANDLVEGNAVCVSFNFPRHSSCPCCDS